jgi:hypothetical protein
MVTKRRCSGNGDRWLGTLSNTIVAERHRLEYFETEEIPHVPKKKRLRYKTRY